MRIDSPTIVGNLTVQGTLSSNNSAIFTALSVVALSSVVNYAPIIINGSNSQSLFQSIQNTTPGVSASTDIRVYNDTGNYLDMGIASSTYNGNLYGPKFNIVGAGDSYLYTTANNLVLGTSLSSNTFTNDIVMFTGGTLSGSNAVGGNERMRITTGGNVGIGTSTPNSALTVVGGLSAATSYGTGTGFLYFGGNTFNLGNTDNNCTLGVTGAGTFSLDVRATNLRAKSTGSIGFSPTTDASTASDVALFRDAPNTLGQRVGLSAQAFNIYNTYTSATSAERASLKWVNNTFVIGTETLPTSASNRDMAFQTASSTRMTITSGGFVGIGTSTPSEKLNVVGNVSASGNIYTSGLSASTTFSPPRYTTTLTPAISAATNGNVIYNTTQGNLNTYNSAQSAWGIVVNSDYVQNISTLTQAQYNALVGGPVATTFYIITDAPSSGTNVANIATKTANYTITSSDYCINSTATIPTGITLPSAIGLAGYIFIIKNSGTSTVTVSAAAGEFIDATSTVSLSTRYSSVRVQSLGTSTGYIIT